MAEKKSLSAREVVADIRVGMTDEQLMEKHMLTAKGLQSLKNKLLSSGLVTQSQLDGRAGPTKVTSQVDKKALAKNIAAAVKTGLPDNEISKRFGISPSKLTSVYNSLIKAGYLAVDDLTKRPGKFEETVDLAEAAKVADSPGQTPVRKEITNERPVFRWLCPACKTPHPEEYAVCPQCGIIVEKYKEKLARTQQANNPTPLVAPQQTIRDEMPKAPARAHTDSVSGATPVPEVTSEFTKKMAQLKEARDRGILGQAEFEKKSEELILQAKHSEAVDKLSELLAAGIITQEEFEAKKDDPLQYQSRLEKLQEALASGVLSQSEFEQKKKELLGSPSSYDSPPSKISSLSNVPGDISGAVGHVARMSLGEKLILVASGIAILSLFLPWVEAGIGTLSGFQQQGFLFLALYIYPVAQILRRAKMSRIGAGICGGLSVLVSIAWIESKSITLFGNQVNAAGTGLYLFTACSILLCVGVYLCKSAAEEPVGGAVLGKPPSPKEKSLDALLTQAAGKLKDGTRRIREDFQQSQSTGQTRFALQIGETLIKEGYTTYLKSTLNVFQGNGYLTSRRFVYCKKSTFLFYFLLGPILGHLVKGTQVVFEIPLSQFSAISQRKHGLGKIPVLETKDGQSYGVGFISQDAWFKSIVETVITFVPGTTVNQDGERIDFISN
jgi:hypothetical protein